MEKLGVESKLAKTVFTTKGLQLLMGQVEDFTRSKYEEDNLISAVFGERKNHQDGAILERVKAQ